MEYASRGNLMDAIDKRIKSKNFFTAKEILQYVAQIAIALMFMHVKHILHRDVKSQNIFIDDNGVLRLGDFGISRELTSTNAKLNTTAGTPYFMAPEVLQGIPYDSKADMWSLGVVAYELITFQKPFEAEQLAQVINKIINEPYPKLPNDCDPNLKVLVTALLNKDHKVRPNVF
jgi:NIMA (never in mitosis gene a)-related kinase 1/4/5